MEKHFHCGIILQNVSDQRVLASNSVLYKEKEVVHINYQCFGLVS